MAEKKQKIQIQTLRHSLAHILALAVKNLYPKAKFAIGPATEDGFFYDFDFGKNIKITTDDLPRIEAEMIVLIKQNLSFSKKRVPLKEAKKIFKGQTYKLKILKELEKQGEKTVNLYKVGDFLDLCKGPHIKNTSQIDPQSFKLVNVSGAYWQGKESNKMLTRISGVAFASKKELKDYLKKLEEAKKRDHRLLGKELELFIFDQEVGAGLPVWLAKGAILRRLVEQYINNHYLKYGYQLVASPHIANINLWKTSGHWNFYRESIYSPIKVEDEEYLLKPMNCPFHIKAYQSKIRGWKEMPVKIAELGTVYRYERSGTLHGLTRVRGFTQDDAHVFCRRDQLADELLKLIKEAKKTLKDFGFKEYEVYLSTRPEKYIGTDKMWQEAEKALKQALKKEKLDYHIDKGGGAFYGPKIDIKIKDSLNRPWQCTTIQVDFNLPERFDVNYVDKNGKKQRVVMIHRAILGSMERFIGVLLEHYKGALPFWLSPEQVWILPVSEKNKKYAQKIGKVLAEKFIRYKIVEPDVSISKRILFGQKQKIPYLIVVGDREQKNKTISLRDRKKGDLGEKEIVEFVKKVEKENGK